MDESNKDNRDKSANELLVAGTTMGLVGAAGTLLTGALCPLCLVGTPLLLGIGLFKKLWNGRLHSAGTDNQGDEK